MNITSFTFVFFIAFLIALYYTVFKKNQWIILLISSMLFYCLCNVKGVIYVFITAVTVYVAAIVIERKIKYSKLVLIGVILCNIGLLCIFKYTKFSILMPLGISFYTFQTIGYLLDVYWEHCSAQKNFLKMLLFVSFFPQIVQGPISEYNQLSLQLFTNHAFDYDNLANGFRRALWGFFKKMVVADAIAPFVKDVFANYSNYTGLTTLLGAFSYAIQIYADFSGYMDIMCGVCEMLGIELTENFKQPYFSQSVAEYWRRWHISLGTWFKKYVYYPIAVSKWNMKLGRAAKKKMGGFVGRNLPSTIALLGTWLATGMWHGANAGYIVWGGINGVLIILSIWLDPLRKKIAKKLNINAENKFVIVVKMVITFMIVTIIKVLPETGSLLNGVNLWLHVFKSGKFFELSLPLLSCEFSLKQAALIVIGVAAMLFVDIFDYQKETRTLHEVLGHKYLWHYAICLVLICSILLFGVYGTGYDPQAFMYFKY